MAPTITAAMINSQEHLTLTHKLRKPLVEKLRRERINSSIEQLQSLLGPEFLKQQPDSKLEKADILEMTVCVLRRLRQQQQHPAVDSAAVGQGYSVCPRGDTLPVQGAGEDPVPEETAEPLQTQSQKRLLNHFSKLQSSSDQNLREADFSPLSSTVQTSITRDRSPVSSAPWRPWQTPADWSYYQTN
ncbi:transcription factor HES-5-like [Cebidichthys violaceus]|uniref:transcription factor HES-5-like n=1 Tax=Cebidichthys violaceus TaxID=271503 RepID=UPI0035C99C1B